MIGICIGVYGLLSISMGIYCVSAKNPVWFHAMIPIFITGIALVHAGILITRRSVVLRKRYASHTLAVSQLDPYRQQVTAEIEVVAKFRTAAEILLVIGIPGSVCALVWNVVASSIGVWVTLVIQGGIVTVMALLMINRGIMHLHELERIFRQSGDSME